MKKNKIKPNVLKAKKYIISIGIGTIILTSSMGVVLTRDVSFNNKKLNIIQVQEMKLLKNLSSKTIVMKVPNNLKTPYMGDITTLEKSNIVNNIENSLINQIKNKKSDYGYLPSDKNSKIKEDIKSWIDISSFKMTPPTFTRKIGNSFFYKKYVVEFNAKNLTTSKFKINLFRYTSLKSGSVKPLSEYAKNLIGVINKKLLPQRSKILNFQKLQNMPNLNIDNIQNMITGYIRSLQKLQVNKKLSAMDKANSTTLKAIQSRLNKLVTDFQTNIEKNISNFTTLKRIGSFVPVGPLSQTMSKIGLEFNIKSDQFKKALSENFPIIDSNYKSTKKTKNLIADLLELNKKFDSSTTSEMINLTIDTNEITNVTYKIRDFVGEKTVKQGLTFPTMSGKKLQTLTFLKTKASISKRITNFFNSAVIKAKMFQTNIKGDIKTQMIKKSVDVIYQLIKKISTGDLFGLGSELKKRSYLIVYNFLNGSTLTSNTTSNEKDALIKKLISSEESKTGSVLELKVGSPDNVIFNLFGTLNIEQKVAGASKTITPLIAGPIALNITTFSIDTKILSYLNKMAQIYNVFSLPLGVAIDPKNTLLVKQLVTTWNILFSNKIQKEDVEISQKIAYDDGVDSPMLMTIGIKKHGNKTIWNLSPTSYVVNSFYSFNYDAWASVSVDKNIITTHNYEGKIKSQIKADTGGSYDISNAGFGGLILNSPFKNRFFFTQIQFNSGSVIYNGEVQNLSNAQLRNSDFYKSNKKAFLFDTTDVSDDEAIVMIDKLTGQLYVLHSQNGMGGGEMKISYNSSNQKYTWLLGTNHGSFTITENPDNPVNIIVAVSS